MKLIILGYLLYSSLLCENSKRTEGSEIVLKQYVYTDWVNIRDSVVSHGQQKFIELTRDSFLKQFQIEVAPAGYGAMEYSEKTLTLNRYFVKSQQLTFQDSAELYILSSETTAQGIRESIDLQSVLLLNGTVYYFVRIRTYIGINPDDKYDITDRTYNFILTVMEK